MIRIFCKMGQHYLRQANLREILDSKPRIRPSAPAPGAGARLSQSSNSRYLNYLTYSAYVDNCLSYMGYWNSELFD